MNTYLNNTYCGETIDLDNCAFRNCVFEDCTLRFAASGPTELSGCSFSRSRLAPSGAAQLALSYLRGFYHGLGEWGRSTIEELFDAIRAGESGDAVSCERGAASFRQALDAFGASPEGQSIVRGFEKLSAERRRQIAELIGLAARRAA
jgi:hypothetical protein